MRKRNPKGKHLKGATAKQQRQYEAIKRSERKRGVPLKEAKSIAAATARAGAKNKAEKKESKGKKALKTTGRALKSAASSVLGAGSKILGAGSKALNPKRRQRRNKTIIKAGRIDHLDVSKVHNPRRRIKVRNAYIDLVIKGRAKQTAQGWKVGAKTFERGRGTTQIKPHVYLDKSTGFVYTKRERNASRASITVRKKAKPNRSVARKVRRPAKSTRAKKSVVIKRKTSAITHARQRANPSAESIRKEFAGSVNSERDLFFPKGTPTGKLAKLGKLVSITTQQGTIKPVNGTAWLCADTKGKLHIGATSDAPLFNGPARSFGKVTKIEYESSKPHLGYKGPIIWFHKVGEENHIKPTLRADGKGGLVFKGGDYRLTERGIEN